MTITEAKKVLEVMNAKAEKAFCEEFSVKPGEYHPSRISFLFGFMQQEMIEVLTSQNKTVLS